MTPRMAPSFLSSAAALSMLPRASLCGAVGIDRASAETFPTSGTTAVREERPTKAEEPLLDRKT